MLIATNFLHPDLWIKAFQNFFMLPSARFGWKVGVSQASKRKYLVAVAAPRQSIWDLAALVQEMPEYSPSATAAEVGYFYRGVAG